MEWLLTSIYSLLGLKTANTQSPPPAQPAIPCCLLPVLCSAAIGLFIVWFILYLLSLRTQYSLKDKHVLVFIQTKCGGCGILLIVCSSRSRVGVAG